MDSEYYSDYRERSGGKRRRSWLLWLLDALLTVVSLAFVVAILLTYLVPYVNPSRVWFFPVLDWPPRSPMWSASC